MLRRAGFLGSVIWVAVLISGAILVTDFTVTLAARDAVRGRAETFKPDCSSRDPLCRAWTEFRRAHPYPYQAFAAKPVNRGRELAIVISEPSAARSKAELKRIIETAFGEDLLSLQAFRWKIGIDGWVEDLVMKVRFSPRAASRGKAAETAPLDDPLLRDRIALLHFALYGTAYGGRLETIKASSDRNERAGTPNVRISAKELHDWMADSGTRWRPIGSEDTPPATWTAINVGGPTRAFTSEDGSLVMLTFPAKRILAALQEEEAFSHLKEEFRHFTVSSDAIVGGVWTSGGQAAIVARCRTRPLEAFPPLRFETFALLAAQGRDELHQSYERSNALAGKMLTGQYEFRDWAPIYLSEPLIDQELGALLNITDQMLKSWSEAGAVEYIYFSYPLKPVHFPFGSKPLSRILKEESGSLFVLFNWNTAGSAVVAKFPDLSVLVTKQTGSLPVTYGSELKPGEAIETGHLMKYEERAYDYFSGLRDPNLERVVQYTLIYQLFRAMAADLKDGVSLHVADKRDSGSVIEARSDSAGMLVEETTQLLRVILNGETRPVVRNLSRQSLATVETDISEKLLPSIHAFRQRHPQVGLEQLARLLADPASENANVQKAVTLYRFRQAEYNQLVEEFNQLSRSLNTEVNAWLRKNPRAVPAQVSTLEDIIRYLPRDLRAKAERQRALESKLGRRQTELENARVNEQIQDHKQLMSDVGEISRPLRSVAWAVCDLNAIRRKYIQLNAAEPNGWIKTPSVVLSWNRESINYEGGHNLNARALHLEPAKGVRDIELAETPNGLVLRFNPEKTDAVAAKATDLARAVEHGQVRNADDLKSIIASSSVEKRSRFDAMGIHQKGIATPEGGRIPQTEPRPYQLGSRVYMEKKELVTDFRNFAQENDCCIFIMQDRGQSSYIAERNPNSPTERRIVETKDTVSLVTAIGEQLQKGDTRHIVFLDPVEDHVLSLVLAARSLPQGKGRNMALARLLGAKRAKPSIKADVSIVLDDLQGKPSVLRVRNLSANLKEPSRIRRIFNRLTSPISKERWASAEVSILSPESAREMARKAGWDTSREGAPSAVVVSLGGGSGGGTSLKLNTIAGFGSGESSAGASRLGLIVRRSKDAAAKRGSTIAQYFADLKKWLLKEEEKAPGFLKGLKMSVDEGESETFVSELETPDGGNGHLSVSPIQHGIAFRHPRDSGGIPLASR